MGKAKRWDLPLASGSGLRHCEKEDRSAAVAAGPGIASARALVVDVDAALPGSGLVDGHNFAAPGCLRYHHYRESLSCR